MEVVLLWLDDIDDLLFTALAAAERLRQLCLQVGLGAAAALACAEQALIAPAFAAAAAAVAAASVGLWLTVALCTTLPGSPAAIDSTA